MKREEKEAKELYDKIAEQYHHHRTKKYPSGWFYNEMLEMPTTLSLLGNIKGKKVLDFGCGTGIYAQILTKKGAKVKGFDISHSMLNIAKQNNPKLDLRQGSGNKIPFNEKFDIVIAPLVLDYIENWDKPFKEVLRVLKKGGIFVFSTPNPVYESTGKLIVKGKKYKVLGMYDYFKQNLFYVNWNIDGGKTLVPNYHKTYGAILKTIVKNGFELIDYQDARPINKAKKLFPKEYPFASRVPIFCSWKVRKK